VMVSLLVVGSILTVIVLPYNQFGHNWTMGETGENIHVPRLAQPVWVNWFRKNDLPSTLILSSALGQAKKTVETDEHGITHITLTYTFEYEYTEFPQNILVYFISPETDKKTFIAFTWTTPDGREYHLSNDTVEFNGYKYDFSENVLFHQQVLQNENWKQWFTLRGEYQTPGFYILFADPSAASARALPGTYTVRIDGTAFEDNADLDAEVIILGQVYGAAGTDSRRRDLMVPLLWGLPYALVIGVSGAVGTTLLSLVLAASGVWIGGWVDGLLQRLIEANIILPVIAIAIIFMAFYQLDMWTVMAIIIVLNAFGSPTKAFRAAFLQIKELPYIEAAQAYGAGNWRIISKYLIPRILPVMIPQMVTLIPSFVFLESTLAIFGVSDPRYPTWGKVLFSALRYGASYGSQFWVLEPLTLLLFTGLAFVLLGFTLNRILNPRLI
jgi:peptide/nickel transport system permease protein